MSREKLEGETREKWVGFYIMARGSISLISRRNCGVQRLYVKYAILGYMAIEIVLVFPIAGTSDHLRQATCDGAGFFDSLGFDSPWRNSSRGNPKEISHAWRERMIGSEFGYICYECYAS